MAGHPADDELAGFIPRVPVNFRSGLLACDTRDTKVALQVQLEVLRFCANTSLVYFLRTMPLAATSAAAALHDARIWFSGINPH